MTRIRWGSLVCLGTVSITRTGIPGTTGVVSVTATGDRKCVPSSPALGPPVAPQCSGKGIAAPPVLVRNIITIPSVQVKDIICQGYQD